MLDAGLTNVLDGVRVICMAELFPGPLCTLILADMGADVIVVERPGGDPARALVGHFEQLNRNKRSVVVDLKTDEGKEVVKRLARRSHVFVEGYRPGVATRLGVDFPIIAGVNPHITYVSISSFGQDGPYALRSGHDLTYQALAGCLDPARGDPQLPQLPLADLMGALYAATSVLAGLASPVQRARHFDLSLLDATLMASMIPLVQRLNGLPSSIVPEDPGYNLYQTADARWLALGISRENHFWRELCGVLGLGHLTGLEASERERRADELVEVVAEAIGKEPLATWLMRLEGANVPAAPVRTIAAVADDPQIQHRGVVFLVPDERAPRQIASVPFLMNGTATRRSDPAPGLGQHSREVLLEAGYSVEELQRLIEEKVVQPEGERA